MQQAVGDHVLDYLTAKEMRAHLEMSPEERVRPVGRVLACSPSLA